MFSVYSYIIGVSESEEIGHGPRKNTERTVNEAKPIYGSVDLRDQPSIPRRLRNKRRRRRIKKMKKKMTKKKSVKLVIVCTKTAFRSKEV